jgi:hypothetical protein
MLNDSCNGSSASEQEYELKPEADRDKIVVACQGLEKDRAILKKLSDELKNSGFAGSTQVPALVYLAMFTRFLDLPVSLLLKGPSGSGKSYALREALKFIPKEAYELYHGMSEKALIYNEGLDLRHRYLIIQEAAGLNKGEGRVFSRSNPHEVVIGEIERKVESGFV